MTTNRMGLEQEDDYGLSTHLEVLEAMIESGDTENQQLICLLLELKRRRESAALNEAERAELLAYRVASKEPVGWTDDVELRGVEKDGCGYLFKANPITPHADPRRVIMLYAAPPIQAVTAPGEFERKREAIRQELELGSRTTTNRFKI